MKNNPLETTPPELIAILTIILVLIAYGLWISKGAENRCIKGAAKESINGVVSQEIIN